MQRATQSSPGTPGNPERPGCGVGWAGRFVRVRSWPLTSVDSGHARPRITGVNSSRADFIWACRTASRELPGLQTVCRDHRWRLTVGTSVGGELYLPALGLRFFSCWWCQLRRRQLRASGHFVSASSATLSRFNPSPTSTSWCRQVARRRSTTSRTAARPPAIGSPKCATTPGPSTREQWSSNSLEVRSLHVWAAVRPARGLQ